MERCELVIVVRVKRGYELPHYIRLNEGEIEFIKETLKLNSIEEIVKSLINKKGYDKKDGYYKYKGEYNLLKDIK